MLFSPNTFKISKKGSYTLGTLFSLVRLSPPVKSPVNLTWEAGWCRWTAVGLCLRRGGFASPPTHGLLLTSLCSTVLISKGTHCLLGSAQKCPCTLVVVCLHLGFLLISCQLPLDLGSTLFTTQPNQFKACFSSHLSLCVLPSCLLGCTLTHHLPHYCRTYFYPSKSLNGLRTQV